MSGTETGSVLSPLRKAPSPRFTSHDGHCHCSHPGLCVCWLLPPHRSTASSGKPLLSDVWALKPLRPDPHGAGRRGQGEMHTAVLTGAWRRVACRGSGRMCVRSSEGRTLGTDLQEEGTDIWGICRSLHSLRKLTYLSQAATHPVLCFGRPGPRGEEAWHKEFCSEHVEWIEL